MKRIINNILKSIKEVEYQLYKEVCNLDNSENECECEKIIMHDFRNIIPVEEGSILCLNCGGYIECTDTDDLF